MLQAESGWVVGLVIVRRWFCLSAVDNCLAVSNEYEVLYWLSVNHIYMF